jgi:hypothetical protein
MGNNALILCELGMSVFDFQEINLSVKLVLIFYDEHCCFNVIIIIDLYCTTRIFNKINKIRIKLNKLITQSKTLHRFKNVNFEGINCVRLWFFRIIILQPVWFCLFFYGGMLGYSRSHQLFHQIFFPLKISLLHLILKPVS